MSFGDHLEELRRRILLAIAVPLPLFIVAFIFSDTLLGWFLLPVYDVLQSHGLPLNLQAISPTEVLMTKLKLSLVVAVVLTAPWLVYQGWCFTAPGLYQQERRFVRFLIPGSAILTLAGLALMYFIMLPLMMHVLIAFGTSVEVNTPAPAVDPRVDAVVAAAPPVTVTSALPESPDAGTIWLLIPEMEASVVVAGEEGVEILALPARGDTGRIDQTFRILAVVNFTLIMLLSIVIAFQMPLVIALLGWLRLISVETLRSHRRWAVAICGVISAMITPADAISMVMMLVPLYGLYELGILLLRVAPASAVAEGRVLRNLFGGSKPAVTPVASDDVVPRGAHDDEDAS